MLPHSLGATSSTPSLLGRLGRSFYRGNVGGGVGGVGSVGGAASSIVGVSLRTTIITAALLMIMIASIMWGRWSSCDALAAPSPSSVLSRSVSLSPAFADEDDSLLPSPSSLHAGLDHLVLVAGHAVLTSLDVHEDVAAPSNWALLSYQTAQVGTFVAHIRRGVELTRDDPRALLIFSGGETRAVAGPRSEAQSYWVVAEHERWFRHDADATDSSEVPSTDPDPVSLRATTEEYARDSFENLLFGVCRFHEVTGSYPSRVTVVGFGFKRHRFESLHRAALRFPTTRFAYEGVDQPPLDDPLEQSRREKALIDAEMSQSARPFMSDPYGCISDGPLAAKRRTRNPFRRRHAYARTCPQMRALLAHCSTNIFDGPLPWDDDDETSLHNGDATAPGTDTDGAASPHTEAMASATSFDITHRNDP